MKVWTSIEIFGRVSRGDDIDLPDEFVEASAYKAMEQDRDDQQIIAIRFATARDKLTQALEMIRDCKDLNMDGLRHVATRALEELNSRPPVEPQPMSTMLRPPECRDETIIRTIDRNPENDRCASCGKKISTHTEREE